MSIVFSCIIPASKKDAESQMLKDLIASIRAQDFPQDQIEILIVVPPMSEEEFCKLQLNYQTVVSATFIFEEGDSEQAKAIGIRRAQGEICAMFCADNTIMDKKLFFWAHKGLSEHPEWSAVYPDTYKLVDKDNSLNRYFSLIGGNDPVCWFLGKNDRLPYVKSLFRTTNYKPSYGCNGFFYRASDIKATNLDNYYPMDNALEVPGKIVQMGSDAIWHRTSDNLLNFLIKRYRYARDLYCDRQDRRWKMLDAREDYRKLGWFILSTVAIVPSVAVSIRGYWKIRDIAWFWHWPVCVGFLITYGLLACRNLLKYRSLSRLFSVQTA